jgi:hypothetical protein
MTGGSADDKKLSPGEIKKLKGAGVDLDPGALKGARRTGQRGSLQRQKRKYHREA